MASVHVIRWKINCLPGGRTRGIRYILFTFPQDAREVASERDVGPRARPANGIPSSTSKLHSHATGTAVLAQCRGLVVGSCGSDAMSRVNLVIIIKPVVTRGGVRKHAWPTTQNSCLVCGAYLKCMGYGWVRCKCSTLSQVVVQYSIYLAPYRPTRKVFLATCDHHHSHDRYGRWGAYASVTTLYKCTLI